MKLKDLIPEATDPLEGLKGTTHKWASRAYGYVGDAHSALTILSKEMHSHSLKTPQARARIEAAEKRLAQAVEQLKKLKDSIGGIAAGLNP